MFGIEINYKNGEKDWIDPVEDEPLEKNGILTVVGSPYTYEFQLENIEKWFKYDLCIKCEYDIRSYGCTNEECFSVRHT